jgi:hypothetical protein
MRAISTLGLPRLMASTIFFPSSTKYALMRRARTTVKPHPTHSGTSWLLDIDSATWGLPKAALARRTLALYYRPLVQYSENLHER